uniref:Uncharacterized protein n=1 Tax=Anguilla anguilla TaxID=7936 RepID=A0A0E9WQI9_ANGAN
MFSMLTENSLYKCFDKQYEEKQPYRKPLYRNLPHKSGYLPSAVARHHGNQRVKNAVLWQTFA